MFFFRYELKNLILSFILYIYCIRVNNTRAYTQRYTHIRMHRRRHTCTYADEMHVEICFFKHKLKKLIFYFITHIYLYIYSCKQFACTCKQHTCMHVQIRVCIHSDTRTHTQVVYKYERYEMRVEIWKFLKYKLKNLTFYFIVYLHLYYTYVYVRINE